jgi:hypothetical protein
MTLARNNIANVKPGNVCPNFNDFASVFMAAYHGYVYGFLRPVIPVIDMNVSAANCRLVDFDENFVSRNFGDRQVLEPQAFFSVFFDKSFHKIFWRR